mgnify:CR=1 FL=1
MPIKYIPYVPNTIEGQAILDNITRTQRILRYRENDKVYQKIQRGMPYYEVETIETVGDRNTENMIMRGECLSACAYLKDRGIKVDLVYIDPPFASGADYAKKVYIRRNPHLAEKIAAAEQEMDIEELKAFEETMYGDIWQKEVITLERMVFPEPVIHIAIEPKTKADQEKMGVALNRLAKEDPSFRVKGDEETNQTIISGMGELHLEILVDRMKREFGVEANVGAPQVAYRETIRNAVEIEGKHVKQSGGKGQYGHVWIRMEPSGEGNGYSFVDEIKGGSVPREFIPSVDYGIKGAMKSGVIAGYPVVDVKVALFDGSYHDVDSSQLAFELAGSMAFKDGMRKAQPVLLEPMMAVEVETPEEYMGDVMGDLSSRRGIIQGMEDDDAGGKKVKAEVPLAEMFGYSTDLRSKTQGRATYSMEFKHYSEAPKHIADAVVSKK